jgi:hypothetical protein
MSETAIGNLIAAPEKINPLLEILWDIEKLEELGDHLIEQSGVCIEDLKATIEASNEDTSLMERTIRILKNASPIPSPCLIRGF